MAAEMFSDIFFLGDLLDPDVCTRRMGMTPSKAYRKGQRHGKDLCWVFLVQRWNV